MAQNRSFKDYVANRFYNEFWNAVSDYLEQNHRDLGVSSRLVRTIDRAELSDIDVKCVYVDSPEKSPRVVVRFPKIEGFSTGEVEF